MVFGEDHRFDVGLINDHVDDGELGVGIIRRHGVQGIAKGKARHDDWVGPSFSQLAQSLLTLSFVLHFQLFESAAGFGGPALRALEGGFVEGFVVFAANVIDDGRVGQSGHGT